MAIITQLSLVGSVGSHLFVLVGLLVCWRVCVFCLPFWVFLLWVLCVHSLNAPTIQEHCIALLLAGAVHCTRLVGACMDSWDMVMSVPGSFQRFVHKVCAGKAVGKTWSASVVLRVAALPPGCERSGVCRRYDSEWGVPRHGRGVVRAMAYCRYGYLG